MNKQTKVSGVVLAGGLARRMNNQDKGLILYQNKAMVSYAVAAMSQVAESVFINANRNKEAYMQFGCDVIADQTDSFDGPLAGVLSAMNHVNTEVLLVMPCDTPLIKAEHLLRLLQPVMEDGFDISVGYDGKRIQPVFLALKTSLQDSLKAYLQQGNRKIDHWLQQHRLVEVDFSQNSDIFININTLAELNDLENKQNV